MKFQTAVKWATRPKTDGFVVSKKIPVFYVDTVRMILTLLFNMCQNHLRSHTKILFRKFLSTGLSDQFWGRESAGWDAAEDAGGNGADQREWDGEEGAVNLQSDGAQLVFNVQSTMSNLYTRFSKKGGQGDI